jgi:HEPN domain-containing protein
MERTQLQRLAETRLSDAEVLLSAQRWDAAYYLLGYCIECALKACIARQFRANDVPDKKLVNSFYTHELDKLLDIAGLRIDMEREATRDSDFAVNWTLVKAWNETVRYDEIATFLRAWEMYDAVKRILQWLKTRW